MHDCFFYPQAQKDDPNTRDIDNRSVKNHKIAYVGDVESCAVNKTAADLLKVVTESRNTFGESTVVVLRVGVRKHELRNVRHPWAKRERIENASVR